MTEEGVWSRLGWLVIAAVVTGVVTSAFAFVHFYWLGIDTGGNLIASKDLGASPGDKGGPKLAARTTRDPLDVLRAAAADLDRADPDQRPQLRYLTLTHVHNNRSVGDADLDGVRQALAEFATFVSPPGRVVTWRPVDGDRTVFAVHLGELGWDADAAWRKLLAEYPYGLTYADAGRSELREADAKVRELTDSRLPCVRADWFLAALLRPPLTGSDGPFPIPAREPPDAVRAVVQGYGGQRVDLATAVAELAPFDAAEVEATLRQTPRLHRDLGLDPLTRGETVPRDAWESLRFGVSPFQELARELGLGTPVR